MTAKKTPPPPQALYMDNVPGGDPEIQLLYARLGTYKMDGEKACLLYTSDAADE